MERYFSISEMASIHGVSRQTLIYYDKIELFQPVHIDENGYRFYAAEQIPFLREICFLKSIGIKLNDIKEHIGNRNLTSAISLLEYHHDLLQREIDSLQKAKMFIQQRLGKYSEASRFKSDLDQPVIEQFPERKVVFVPFANEICRKELHVTLMKAWHILSQHEMLPSDAFGTLILKDQLGTNQVFKGAGIFTALPLDDTVTEQLRILPAGQYACMYKYGMPYETQCLKELVQWIEEQGYRITGDVIDACLLDTTFYETEQNVDFCQLQIPVEKMV
ncbi:MerR family transcriptional regulator [Fictibacillus enclensis]|uniref:MerR family transcriptional regulator n=1 Tax=Fictibacillus enclensis TaxID=1017270 RepID=UPI0025A23839|nr:MerR family transcriptional regulator [Fictibacillus enclensis]MDM5200214.1 MerR family transcriptional regulator [Fictibacillus enclensis]